MNRSGEFLCINYFITINKEYFVIAMIIKANFDGLRLYCTGLSESFEVDGRVVKISGQSRDILFKKRHL